MRLAVAVVVLLISLSLPAGSAVIYVSTDGSDSNPGTSWESAKQTVQAGIDAAAAGDEVRVAGGTYVENITLKEGVKLYGGFEGTGDVRNPDVYTTTFDGNQNGSVVTALRGISRATVIDGFVITNGNGRVSGSSRMGGGMYCEYASPTISNNVITRNSSGGGICTVGQSSPLIARNVIAENVGANGGGILSGGSSPLITSNTISSNIANYNGGAMAFAGSAAVIESNLICDNRAVTGSGGGINSGTGSLTITGNIIARNSASRGGALWCGGGNIVSNTIVGNINTDNSSPEGIVRCIVSYFCNNIIAFNNSALSLVHENKTTIRGNCVYNPEATSGSGLINPSDTVLEDPLFADLSGGDYHLTSQSPCIDSGWNDAPGLLDTDWDGQTRVKDDSVDIGVYEYSLPRKIVYVDGTGGDDQKDGLSWQNAKKTVQAGLNAIGQNGQVWVARGIYYENITLKPNAQLYGGFTGLETSLAERAAFPRSGVDPDETILDARYKCSVVVSPEGATRSTRIDGFTIQNGQWSSAYYEGAGICCQRSSPTIVNNKIRNNKGSNGGGMYFFLSFARVENNNISENTASTSGGAIRGDQSSLTIRGNTITGNRAGYYGGGIYLRLDGATNILDNTLRGNRARQGGGIACYNYRASILRNIIEGNAADYGGGLFLNSVDFSFISQNSILLNHALISGSGIECYASSPTIASNLFRGNTGGRAAFLDCQPYTFLVNNTFTAHTGYASCYINGQVTVANNIIAYNDVGIEVGSSGLKPSFQKNCVYNPGGNNYLGTEPGFTDIQVDPGFASYEYDNFHLRPDSPCRNAGYNGVVQADWLDIDGQPRIEGGTVDIGADESYGEVHPPRPHTIIRVSPKNKLGDNNDGSSWAQAKRTVQAAIDAASVQGGDVWVAASTYYERIILKPYVHVYGGFSGYEETREERDRKANPTILDANANGTVVTADLTFLNSTIDGFTIRNGSQSGIRIPIGSAFISNNRIINNTNSDDGGGIVSGGGSIITGNEIVNNKSAGYGGAMSLAGWETVAGNVITSNVGGIYCNSPHPVITNNTIVSNIGWVPGSGTVAIYRDNTTSPDSQPGPLVSNNIIAHHWVGAAVPSNSVVGMKLYNNCFFNPGGYGDYFGASEDVGNFSADPLFRNPELGDYHLLSSSPCINAGWNDAPGLPETDIDGEGRINWGTVDIGADEYWPMKVQIDIQPGQYPNYVNFRSKGLLPVAILSSPGFDATTIDPASIEMAGAGVAGRGKSGSLHVTVQDVDLDGDMDLLVNFDVQSLMLAPDATSATLTGRIRDGGDYITGSDSVVVIPGK